MKAPDSPFDSDNETLKWKDAEEDEIECHHVCTSNCRRVGCNCECGEWHEAPESYDKEEYRMLVQDHDDAMLAIVDAQKDAESAAKWLESRKKYAIETMMRLVVFKKKNGI